MDDGKNDTIVDVMVNVGGIHLRSMSRHPLYLACSNALTWHGEWHDRDASSHRRRMLSDRLFYQ